MNDASDFFQWLLAAWLGLASAVIGTIYVGLDRLRDKQAAFETKVAADHPTKADIRQIDQKLDRILEKLEDKADK